MEHAESIDLRWFENMKYEPCEELYSMLVAGGRPSPSRFQKKNGLVKQLQKSWMPKRKGKMQFILPEDHEWRNESLHTSRPRSSHRISTLSSMNFFCQVRDCELIQRAAGRRGYAVMRSRFLNFGDDIHDQLVRERITSAIQRIPHTF